MADAKTLPAPSGATGVLVLADGTTIWGKGFGAEGRAVGEVCFNTSMTGYQEIMTDPSYARQIVTFTFPHIGNVGANYEDVEADNPHALGCVIRQDVTEPSNFRATQGFVEWMRSNGRIGLSGVDTRALTRLIRTAGAPNGVIAYSEAGAFDVPALIAEARAWPGLEGMDLAKEVTTRQTHRWSGGLWHLGTGYDDSPLPQAGVEEPRGGEGVDRSDPAEAHPPAPSRRREGEDSRPHVVAIDYGAKRNIFRNLEAAGARVTVMPATATFEEVMAHEPDGFFLSNGPGDPAATGDYAVPVIRKMLETGKPLFGICLGHQLLGLAVGGRTAKMHQGHRGANHPVKRIEDGRVEITSMNHGFAVERESLPANVRETHVSLFDGSNCGIELTDRPAFSVQYHPEASPGPQDSRYLFGKFVGTLK
ncbi:glutamine-hydrolyzing carbamoyl-phosphate synthase small subunit [Sphingosinicella ginsenosidimutans]|uniref:Carbamoyl phosphate synthase small chain n=1 Tax=Allosphingosinicella ginsenosidimutans TaxID=1176539 RepID=A0A5C6TWC4_9SPHN|nr:glutamine-hydrolyzing carbamoyl-phosphate synthase small subunit [Sphingosinicella ginsenosidimutans]TXC64460.1 glutamine-hydrolyzing carbamoyl-phosphate synthase small subunit [Sphingosinicella ginsenosidimutans]